MTIKEMFERIEIMNQELGRTLERTNVRFSVMGDHKIIAEGYDTEDGRWYHLGNIKKEPRKLSDYNFEEELNDKPF